MSERQRVEMKVLSVCLLAALGWSLAQGRNVTRCELKAEVQDAISDLISNTSLNGPHLGEFIAVMVGKIVCHADTVSNFSTSAQTCVAGAGDGQNQNCTLLGIFQLNSCRFCNDGTSATANSCGIPCSRLVDDDLRDDVLCLLSVSVGPGPIEMRTLRHLLEITAKIRREDCEHLHPDDYFAGCV